MRTVIQMFAVGIDICGGDNRDDEGLKGVARGGGGVQ